MMLLEKPRIDLTSTATGGDDATLGDILRSTDESMRLVDNANSRLTAWERSHDERIDAVKKATGVQRENPLTASDRPFAPDRVRTEDFDPHADFQKRLEEIAAEYPDQRDIIGHGARRRASITVSARRR